MTASHTQPRLLDVPARRPCDTTCRTPGLSHAHCGPCHRTFASVTDFDRHRADAGHTEGRCTHPEGLGLVDRDGLWATPERHANDARLAEQLAASRAGGRAADQRAAARTATTAPDDQILKGQS